MKSCEKFILIENKKEIIKEICWLLFNDNFLFAEKLINVFQLNNEFIKETGYVVYKHHPYYGILFGKWQNRAKFCYVKFYHSEPPPSIQGYFENWKEIEKKIDECFYFREE